MEVATKDLAESLTAHIALASKPRSPLMHLVPSGQSGARIYLPNGSRTLQVPAAVAARLEALLDKQDEAGLRAAIVDLGLDAPDFIDDQPLVSPPVHALSLAIAQKCNMGCNYCYAGQGEFGGPAQNMPLETAFRSIDLLMEGKNPGEKVQLTFLGGEPLINRKAIREATAYAAQKAKEKGLFIGFSITTNGTLLKLEDADFFEEYAFAVTISLDGLKEEHDALRPLKNGGGSFDRIMSRIRPLLEKQRKMQVSARVTVSPSNMNLVETLEAFIAMGFHSVGFSPLLRASDGQSEMSKEDLEQMLGGMIACGLAFERNVMAGKRFPFLNMVNAMKEISKSTHRPYPCGAGAGYFGVSASGELSACHRFVNEEAGQMGNIFEGINPEKQNTWLANRHVHQQSPCNGCWARYQCGGGCHHEVIDKGRHACDYIRGWLHYALQAHERLSRFAPDWNK